MDLHTVELLEFSSIVQEMAESCFSPQGRERIRSEEILTDPEEIQRKLELASAFRRILESGRSLPNLDFPDLYSLMPRMSKSGTCFDEEELSRLGRFIISAGRLRRYLCRAGKEDNTLAAIASRIPDLKKLTGEIFTVVDNEGNLKYKNLPVLKGIKSRIRDLQQKVDRLARGYLSNEEYRRFWQTDTPTQKDGRTVLPLKSNFKGRIKGIVHEVSASGATIYVEPLDIVEKNNEIVQLQNRYRIEVRRILKGLSARVAASAAELISTVQTVSELDSLYARAIYAIRMRCTPACRSEGDINLRQARHPLIGSGAVPITLSLDRRNRVLIITGPNTGGKTVTLKTVGFLALMNQFGMEIPAQEGSSLAVFDNIFADIGDEQSIEQSLSTFSAHMVNISRIVRTSTARSLVLFDELGAGTDPEEGVAIGMSLLDHFIEKGCLTLATTHHGILKNYGYSRAGVENAAMEFDQQNLAPTFHIVMGIPGESHALEIARRNGIPDLIVLKAQDYLHDERSDISKLIRRLSQKQRELLDSERETRLRASELKEKSRETELRNLRLHQRESELREEGLIEIKRFLRDSRRELEGLVRDIREGELNKAKTAMVRDFTRKLESRAREEERKLESERSILHSEPGVPLGLGMEVDIIGTAKRGKIIRKGKGESWIVETDNLRGSFLPGEIKPAAAGYAEQERQVLISEELVHKDLRIELDLRGCRLEEAIGRLEQQIDSALMWGLEEFSVIHGKGEGVLQRGVHLYLGQRREVKEYFFSSLLEGGFGKTIVKL
ncbi:Endonuclease MutS2 [subsurface metagenome]